MEKVSDEEEKGAALWFAGSSEVFTPRTCPDALAAFDLTSSLLRSFDSYTWQLRIHFLILPRSSFDGAEAYSDQQPQDQQLDFELNAVRNYYSIYLFLSCYWVASFTQRISLLE